MKAHEGTLAHMKRMDEQALDRGEGELELADNPGAVQYYVKRKYGDSHRYYKLKGVPVAKTLDLTEWNKQREEFHKTDRATGCSARVFCPTCEVHGNGPTLMVYATEVVLSNAGNMPAKRQVQCRVCHRTGTMIL